MIMACLVLLVVEADPGQDFIDAAGNGNIEAVKKYLFRPNGEPSGNDFNVRGKDGWTACMRASEQGHVEAVRILLEAEGDKGADMEATNNYNGMTALMLASQKGHSDVVALLLEKGANTEAKSNW